MGSLSLLGLNGVYPPYAERLPRYSTDLTAPQARNGADLEKACADFESYFLQMMFREMRKTAVEGGFMPKSQAENIFQDMLDEEYAKKSAKAGGVGLADTMLRQLRIEKGP